MIKPTWQDRDRRVIYVPTDCINLNDPIACAKEGDRGLLEIWSEASATVKLDGRAKLLTCSLKNLFWEDGNDDFDELRSLCHE